MKHFETFAAKQGIALIPSYTNFVTLQLRNEQKSSDLAFALLKKGIIVRDLSSYGLNAIRVTVGTPEQNRRFFEQFAAVL